MKLYEVNYHYTDLIDNKIIYDTLSIKLPNDFPITLEYLEFACKPSYINSNNYKIDSFSLISNNDLDF